MASLARVRESLHPGQQVLLSLADALQRDMSPDEAATGLALGIVCGSAVAARFANDWHKCRAWLGDQSAPWERFLLDRIESAQELDTDASFGQLTHLYEHLLRLDQPDRRKRAGVFYTPQPIVRYMLREIDQRLREEFSLPLGLADMATWGQERRGAPELALPQHTQDGDPFIKLFDPAVGTGTFLLEAIDFIHSALVEHWRSQGLSADEIAGRWDDYVPRQLLPRLWGMELWPAPCFLARLHVAFKLAQSGYRFDKPGRIEIYLGNTLAGPATTSLWSIREPAYDIPFTVVLGNPPFSYLSENQSDWITALVRGENGHAGYLQADGEMLNEKKTWLHDDYVKFIRYAQWRIDTTGCGIAALVANHGYLTNATFRIMRQQLLKSFPRISILDLHGNRKAREVAPDGSRDENVFGLDQGIAIGFFRRPPGEVNSRFEHAALWGSRAAKFERLNVGQVFNLPRGGIGQVENLPHAPKPPDYLLVPAIGEPHPEYAAAPSLTELFPQHASAPVTARDHFVVAFTRAELCQRLEAFRDLSIPDEEIRGRYFTRTRSARYERGDTRGWKLAAARRTLAEIENWESYIQPCQYRPLDWRWIFWHPAMIDWPRIEVTRHLVNPKSGHPRSGSIQGPKSPTKSDFGPWTLDFGLALIARRQLPPSEPATYFWVTTALTLDGIIRNDNRGSESLFLSLENRESIELAHYAYALFHASAYRQRYAAALRTGYPRVLPAGDRKLTAALADIGSQLVALHVQRPETIGPSSGSGQQRLLAAVAPRYPQFERGQVWIDDGQSIATVDAATWQFRIGAHQVARKWLADRRGRPLTERDWSWYGVILDTIAQTRALIAAVDAKIEQFGGFPTAFGRQD